MKELHIIGLCEFQFGKKHEEGEQVAFQPHAPRSSEAMNDELRWPHPPTMGPGYPVLMPNGLHSLGGGTLLLGRPFPVHMGVFQFHVSSRERHLFEWIGRTLFRCSLKSIHGSPKRCVVHKRSWGYTTVTS